MSHNTFDYEVIIIGAGAAGMMCAAHLHGQRVLLIDHASKIGEKIRISGGGRCNFTNLNTSWQHYISQSPRFSKYALACYTPQDFIQFIERYDVQWEEKHRGQLFAQQRSQAIIQALQQACKRPTVHWSLATTVQQITPLDQGFQVDTNAGQWGAQHLVIATGGMAAPAIGATDFGLHIARQFRLQVVEPYPALVPLIFDHWEPYATLSGISLPVQVSIDKTRFHEDLLFTHRGLSGPAILQISSFWCTGKSLIINLCPEHDLYRILLDYLDKSHTLVQLLSSYLPKRLVQLWLHQQHIDASKKLAEISHKVLYQLAQSLHHWQVTPRTTAGYKKAEVMRGGVSTQMLEATTMQVKSVPNLFFIGEVVDMTGELGGYNFQWAWSSAVVCANAIQRFYTD